MSFVWTLRLESGEMTNTPQSENAEASQKRTAAKVEKLQRESTNQRSCCFHETSMCQQMLDIKCDRFKVSVLFPNSKENRSVQRYVKLNTQFETASLNYFPVVYHISFRTDKLLIWFSSKLFSSFSPENIRSSFAPHDKQTLH